MTKRINPTPAPAATPAPAESTAPAPTVDPAPADVDMIRTAVEHVDRTDPAAVLAAVTPVVREWSTDRRTAAIMAGIRSGLDAVTLAAVDSAPTGPDPVAAVRSAIDAAAMTFATFVRSCQHVDGLDVDPAAVLAAALTRVTPADVDPVDVDALTRPTSTRPRGERRGRTTVARDWTRPNVAGVYNVPASSTTGASATTITVRVTPTGPTFTTAAGAVHRSPTAALADCQGWTAAGLSRGWGNPFTVLRRANGPAAGSTLAALVDVPATS
jgi:hypothetical protein